jgi:hypothetical protein
MKYIDIILLTNILFIALFAFLKRTKENITPFYSFSLILGILTCGYLFYRYGMREQSSTMTIIYFFSSPLLLIIDIVLIYRQAKSQNGLGITTFLLNVLSIKTKAYLDRIFPATIFFTFITALCWLIVSLYESNLQTPTENEPFRYSLLVTHFLWQFLYVLPLTIMFWFMGIRKFAWTFLVCSVLYPFVLLNVGIIYGWLRN